jgi:gamma-butyrobetaine dioxygenase
LCSSFEKPHNTSNLLVPTISYDEVMHTEKGLFQWLCHLHSDGLSLITNVPDAENEVTKVASRVATPSHSFLYGGIFDVKAKGETSINIAYTSEFLELHQDLVYYESPPGIQILHCLQFDSAVTGGESGFLDVHAVAEKMKQLHPEAFRVLCQVPATFEKKDLARENPAFMRYQRPHISVNSRDEVIAVYWAPPFEGVLSVPSEDVDNYYQAYELFKELIQQSQQEHGVKFKLEEGEMVAFNQRRLLHGREQFTGEGIRHLQGAYLNIDEFASQYRVLQQKFSNADCASRHIGNDSYGA